MIDYNEDYFKTEKEMSGKLISIGNYNIEWATNNEKEANAILRITSRNGNDITQSYRYDIIERKQIIVNRYYPEIAKDIFSTLKMVLNFNYSSKDMPEDKTTLWQLLIYNINNAHKDDNDWELIPLDLDIPAEFKLLKKPGRKKKGE